MDSLTGPVGLDLSRGKHWEVGRRTPQEAIPMSDKIPDREITPERTYLNRRTFMRAGVVAATAVATGLVYRRLNRVSSGGATTAELDAVVAAPVGEDALAAGFRVDEAQTPFESI